MGLPVAESRKEAFHYSAPFDPKTGALLNQGTPAENYTDAFARHMIDVMRNNSRVVTLTAGTPGAIGFYPERREAAGKQFVDVGICEQTATAVGAGLAKGGARPVFGVMSTFIQRAYDQLSQDIAINDLPAVVVDFAGSVWGIPDMTHLGFFDIAMVSNIPNFIFLAPANMEEYIAAIDWAIAQTEHPVFVRTPGGAVVHTDKPVDTDFSHYVITEEEDSKVAIIGAGSFQQIALEAAGIMRQRGVNPTVINPRILSALDTATLDTLRDYDTVITLEDGIVDGGFGQKAAAYLGDSAVKVHVLGLRKEFVDRYNAAKLMHDNGITPEQIAALA